MKVVLDVGQYVSATIQRDGHPAQILAAWRAERFELVTSIPILDDLRRVLFYERVRKRHRWDESTIHAFVDAFLIVATLTPGNLDIRAVVSDPADDKILACAVEGHVDYIVASDKHLTDLRVYEGIPIVTPRQFLDILEGETL